MSQYRLHYFPESGNSYKLALMLTFCGQAFEIVVDTSVAFQRFTTDCEICCRPFEVHAECEPGEILSLDVQAN